MGKYIIDLPENTHWIQWIMEGTKDHHPYMDFKQVEDLTPYTEPDMEQVRKEGYQQGYKDGYNNRDIEKIRKRGYDKGLDDIGNALRLLLFQYSNYTLQEMFGYDTVRAVVEHYEGSEIVARIRCYEGGVKQDAETIRKEAYDKAFEDAEQVAESGKRAMYQKGLSDAWEAARKIVNSPLSNHLEEIFNTTYEEDVLPNFSASEAIEKIRQYEQEKEEQIQVGDEVEWNGDRYVVTYIDVDETYVDVIDCSCGSVCDRLAIKSITKTGRHFPEIVEVFAKMREN